MTVMEFIVATGITGTTIVGLQQLIMWFLKRHADKKDGEKKSAEARLADVEAALSNMVIGQRAILHDRVKWLGMEYQKKKEIGFDNRQGLMSMHNAYKALGGNGNLDVLMDGVLKLPLVDDK